MQKIYTIDPIDALKISIQSEKEMHAFYKKAVALIKDEDSQSILLGLSKHAEEHREKSMDMYSKVSGKKILFLNLDKRHKLKTLQRCSSDPNDAIRIAKKNEKELSNYYITVSRRFLDPELRDYFRDLATQNQQHIALLEASFEEPLTLDEESEDENVLNSVSDENPVKNL